MNHILKEKEPGQLWEFRSCMPVHDFFREFCKSCAIQYRDYYENVAVSILIKIK